MSSRSICIWAEKKVQNMSMETITRIMKRIPWKKLLKPSLLTLKVRRPQPLPQVPLPVATHHLME